MRVAAASAIVSLALFVGPALAESSGMNTGPNPSSNAWSQSGQTHSNYQDGNYSGGQSSNYNNQMNGQAANSGNAQYGDMNRHTGRFSENQQNGPGVTFDTQRRLRQSLEQNGFRNVQVVPESFMIRAQAPDGSRVVMEVSPDMVQGVVENTGSSTGHNFSNEGSTQSPGGQWHSPSGTSDGMNGADGTGNPNR